MKANHILIGLLISTAALQACQNGNRENRDEAATTPADSTTDTTLRAKAYTADVDLEGDEKSFIVNAATGGMMEVEAGKLAEQKSTNTAIKSFAAMMVKEHTKANVDLTKIAKDKGLAVPTLLPDDKMQHIAQMKTLTGRSFDVQYMQMMIADHAKTEALFAEASKFNNPNLKAFALNTLPVIQVHHKKAIEIGKKLNITNANNGDDIGNISPDAASQKH